MYKVVDTFNGYESEKRFQTMEEAEKALQKDYEEFYSFNTENTRYMKQVVPANFTWYWSQRENQWTWG